VFEYIYCNSTFLWLTLDWMLFPHIYRLSCRNDYHLLRACTLISITFYKWGHPLKLLSSITSVLSQMIVYLWIHYYVVNSCMDNWLLDLNSQEFVNLWGCWPFFAPNVSFFSWVTIVYKCILVYSMSFIRINPSFSCICHAYWGMLYRW